MPCGLWGPFLGDLGIFITVVQITSSGQSLRDSRNMVGVGIECLLGRLHFRCTSASWGQRDRVM